MAKHADANTRAKRTLLQGAIVTALMAVAGVTIQIIGSWTHDEFTNATAWVIYATSVAQAILTSLASWVQRVVEETHGE